MEFMEAFTVIMHNYIIVASIVSMNQALRINCWTAALSKETATKEITKIQPMTKRDAFDLF
jgi:hypothetical protein